MHCLNGTDIRIYNDNFEKSKIKHAIFDFDGTISILREGWEKIMEPVMLDSICGDQKPTQKIIDRVKKFIDETTGIQTIQQMEGLIEIVEEIGLLPKEKIMDARAYKKIYNNRLMVPVQERILELESGKKTLEDITVKGSLEFCRKLYQRGVMMYLASGTDLTDVLHESEIVQVAQYFKGRIYGAIGTIEEYSKDKVIKEILKTHNLCGSELVVFGDGPVEIRNAKENGAIAIGVASDELKGQGWNEAKVVRLLKANCDILIPDFTNGDELINYLFGE